MPELNLPEATNANPVLNEGEALIETVPIPKAKPQDRPVDVAMSDPQRVASADGSDARPKRPPAELKQASELYSADTLSDPRVRQALGKLPKDRRIVQMCMIETLEQVRRARPDTVPQGLFFDPPQWFTDRRAGDDGQWCRLQDRTGLDRCRLQMHRQHRRRRNYRLQFRGRRFGAEKPVAGAAVSEKLSHRACWWVTCRTLGAG
ncbi:hypothetical protein LP421_28240 [Rhizobium sp. RCAM05350]|nr:hypothetical protein LP421_28240 [Rhizobium sp. RCAM05350]